MATGRGDTRSVRWHICQAPVGSPHLCSARAKAGVHGWTPLYSCVAHASQRLHIGANDIANPADFGVAVDFTDAGLFLAETIFQGLDCNIESDFVPEFE